MNNRNSRYNRSGYLDMTAYLAIRNIEREEITRRNKCSHNYNLKTKHKKGELTGT